MAEMKKAMSESTKDILKCIIVLTAIALVAGVLLGVVNFFTYVDPDAAMLEEIGETYGVGSSQIEKANDRVINKSGEKSYVNSSGIYFFYSYSKHLFANNQSLCYYIIINN